jgi:Zn finger protein HypA/HybF involved in hydrogenase expression
MSKYKKEELEKLIFEDKLPYDTIGELYGVTGASIRKAANRLGIELPKRREINPTETFNKGVRKVGEICCENCGQPLKSHQLRFCSRQCKADFEYTSFILRWQNGQEEGLSGKDGISGYIEKYVRIKHNNKCQKCGWNAVNESSGKVPLHIHHVDGDSHNNQEDNLELLCPNCHSLTDNYGSLNKESTRTSLKELREVIKSRNLEEVIK